MFKEKPVYPTIKRKQLYFLLIFLFPIISFLYGQSVVVQDSIISLRQDSIRHVQEVRDSINFQNLIIDKDAPNHYLDSIKTIVIVKDNNFVGWINNMNRLKAKNQTFSTAPSFFKLHRSGWILLVIMILFTAIGLVRIFFYNNFYNIVNGFYNDRVLAQINKEDSLFTSWPYIFLYTIFTLSLGLFITIYRSYIMHLGPVEFTDFLKISVGLALLFLLKIIFVRIIGVLFDIEKLVREYIVFLYLFYFNSVLILMPLLLFIAFIPAMYFKFLLIFFLVVIAILFLYRFLKTISILIGSLRFSIFYLILYLCTLEIAPILILVKSLNK